MNKCNLVSNSNKPIHCDKISLIWLSLQKNLITISPKADGIYSEIKNEKSIYQCEYIENLDLYLVFDSKSYPVKHSNNLVNRMTWIRNMHKVATNLKINIINSIEDLEICVIKDINLLKKYLTTTNDIIKWYPKIIMQLNLDPLKVLYYLEKNIDNLLIFKTDGWIISCLKPIGKLSSKIYKYKPKNELTIDILFDNNCWYSKEAPLNNINDKNIKEIYNNSIWRCNWDNNNWIPCEIRKDKKIPNNIKIIRDLENIHNNYWSSSDLIYFIKNYYYCDIKENLSVNEKIYLSCQREIMNKNVSYLIKNNKIENILDIGCGKGYLCKIINKNIKFVGIDIDPVNIFILMEKYSSKNYRWIWEDINNFELNFEDKYDFIVINNVIHLIENHQDFFNNLNKITKKGSLLYIHFLDEDLINFNEIINDKIKIYNEKQNYYFFQFPWKKNVIKEKMISFKELDSVIIKNNWYFIDDIKICSNIMKKIYDKEYENYLNYHRYLTYIRL